MKITFYSNYFNHHQQPFCEEMYKLIGDEFTFVQTMPMEAERTNLGWGVDHLPSYVIKSYENESNLDECKKLAVESDVVIIGSAPKLFLDLRMQANKLTFFYAERLFKKGQWRRFIPTTYKKVYDTYIKYKNKKVFMLSASAYTSSDLVICGFPQDKCYKWGYFPEVKKHQLEQLLQLKDNQKTEILWAGRMIDWKHTAHAIEIAYRIKQEGYKFNLKIIGSGVLEGKLKQQVIKYNITDCVEFLGAMAPDQVRIFMEKANIYLFTSDFQEGWGAVLNEAMNSGCAVIASHAIGSVPFLLEHGKNGLIYKSKDVEDLYNKVKAIIDKKELQIKMGKNALATLENEWNPKVAAERFYKKATAILNNEQLEYSHGPVSQAQIIKNNWFKG